MLAAAVRSTVDDCFSKCDDVTHSSSADSLIGSSRIAIKEHVLTSSSGPKHTDLELRLFSGSELSAVAFEWETLAGSDEFEVELSSVFEWASDHLVSLPGDGHAIQVFNVKEGRTQAILEMIDSRRGSRTAMSKLLKIWVSPEFWPADRDPSVRSGFVELYAGILVHMISNAMSSNMDEIRIYARTDALYHLLTDLQSGWGSLKTLWSATIEGRWFVLLK